MMQLCLQESRRRYIKDVTLCCEDVKEPGQYECKNYPNYKPKGKRPQKKNIKKNLVDKPQKSSKHLRHENLTQENFNPENR